MPWNGNLGMSNVLELTNAGDNDLLVTVEMLDLAGRPVSSTDVAIAGKSQIDIAVNLLAGFRTDSYGLVRLSFATAVLDGRMSFYRFVPSSADPQFAFSLPFSEPLLGRSAVGFNTYQPSLRPEDQAFPVPQWLTLINLNPTQSREFVVHRYGHAGNDLGAATFAVGPLARRDVEVGLTFPGPNQVGLNVIEPADPTSPYLAHLIRYGASEEGFSFALPLLATTDNNSQWVPVSRGGDADNWLELINAKNEVATVNFILRRYNALGLAFVVQLQPFEQIHFRLTTYLSRNESAAAQINGQPDSQILAHSVFYFRSADGRLTTLYGVQPRKIAPGLKAGSYNLHLDANNWLRLFNVVAGAPFTSEIVITFYAPNGVAHEKVFTVHPLTGRDIPLHEFTDAGLGPNTYGLLTVNGPMLADVLRISTSQDGVNLAIPTAVR